MSVKSMLTVGFLSMMAATAVVTASDSFAAHRADLIESPQETVVQADSMKSGAQCLRVDVIESVGAKGPVYSYTPSLSH